MSCLYAIVSYLYVSCSGSITSGKRGLFFLLSFTCNYVVSVGWAYLLTGDRRQTKQFCFLNGDCLVVGKAALYKCGTPWTFLIIIYLYDHII